MNMRVVRTADDLNEGEIVQLKVSGILDGTGAISEVTIPGVYWQLEGEVIETIKEDIKKMYEKLEIKD